MNIERDIREFREAFGLPVNDTPTLLGAKEMNLHRDLIIEEYLEMAIAWEEGDLTEVFDGIVDMIYVLGGLAVHMGLPLEEGWREVHASNCSKLGEDGSPVFREDGKVLKGPGYFPPGLKNILEERNG